MSSLWDEMARDGEENLKEVGREVLFRQKKYLCMVDPNALDEVMVSGGMQIGGTFRVKFLAAIHSDLEKNPPKWGEQIELYGRAYTVRMVTYRPPSPWIETLVQVTD